MLINGSSLKDLNLVVHISPEAKGLKFVSVTLEEFVLELNPENNFEIYQ